MLEWLNKINLGEVFWKALWQVAKPLLLNWQFWLIILGIIILKWIEHQIIRHKK